MSPTRMHAVLLSRHGDLAALEYRGDVPIPQPGPGEVLVRVNAAAVNNTDINLRTGWYSPDSAGSVASGAGAGAARGAVEQGGWSGSAVGFPLIQGADGCGEIASLGAGVGSLRIGERVLIDPILRPSSGSAFAGVRYLGSDCHGTFAEFVAVPAANALPVHSALSDAELASFPCSFVAAENMLSRACVSHGEEILVTGASGGVGTAAVQLARRRGARVTAVAAAAKAETLKSLGAAEVVTGRENLASQLGPESFDAVVDVVGGSSFAALLGVLKRGGRYAVAGAIAGPLVELDLRTLYLKDLTLYGCTIPEIGLFARLVGYIEKGEVRPVVAGTFRLRDLAAAQRAFLEKTHVGKIVVVP